MCGVRVKESGRIGDVTSGGERKQDRNPKFHNPGSPSWGTRHCVP